MEVRTLTRAGRGGARLFVAGLCAVLTGACDRGVLGIAGVDAPVEAGASADPALGIDPGSGDLLLSWAARTDSAWTLRFARSSDGGRTWTAPVDVAGGARAPGEVRAQGESSVRLVAAPGGRVALVWPNRVAVPGRRWPGTQIRLARSTDGGRTWSAPVTLNDDTTGVPVSHQFHGAAWQGDSGLVVAWLDERPGAGASAATAADSTPEPDAAVMAVASPDFGASWGVNRKLWGAACPCCRVSLARSRTGEVLAAWRRHFPGNVRDVVVAPVTPGGAEPIRVRNDGWVYAGCPHTGPAVVAADSAAHVVWYTGRDGGPGVYYRRLAPGGASPPAVALIAGGRVPTAHAAVASLADGGALAVTDVANDARRRVEVIRIGADGRARARAAVPGSEGGAYPQVAMVARAEAVVAFTLSAADRPTVRLVRVAIADVATGGSER